MNIKNVSALKVKRSMRDLNKKAYALSRSFKIKEFPKGRQLARSKNDFTLAKKILEHLEGTKQHEPLEKKLKRIKNEEEQKKFFHACCNALRKHTPEGYYLDFRGDGVGFYKENF